MLNNRFHGVQVGATALLLLLAVPITAQPVDQAIKDVERNIAEAREAQSWVNGLHEETDEVLGGAAEELLKVMKMQLEHCQPQGSPVAPCDGWQEQIDDLLQKLARLQKVTPEEVTKRIDKVRNQLEADQQKLAGIANTVPGLAELEQDLEKVLDTLQSKKFKGDNGRPQKAKRKLDRLRNGAEEAIDADELQATLDKLRAKECCTDSSKRGPREDEEPAEEKEVPGAEPATGDREGGKPGAGGVEQAEKETDQEGKGNAEAPRDKVIEKKIERLKEKYEEETGRDFDDDADEPTRRKAELNEETEGLLWDTEQKVEQLEDELEELAQRLPPEQAWQRWHEFVEGVRKLKGVLERDGHDPGFLDDFLKEFEDQRHEWEEPPTRRTLERLKKKLERRMGGEDDFTPEELDDYLDEVFGSAFGGQDSPDRDGTDDRRPPGVPPEARQVDDVIDLGTLERRLYEFPITAANTSCLGRHDFRTTFEPAAQTPGGWFHVADPHALSDLRVGETKTVQAEVDLRTVEVGALEGVLRIVCTTCPPPPVCTQNETVFLVRATVQD